MRKQRCGTGFLAALLVALVGMAISGAEARGQGLLVHQERGMDVFLVACDGRTDPASATVVVDLKSEELRREAANQLEALAVAPEEALGVTRRVSTFLFGDGGARWQIQREIFLNGTGEKIAATENKDSEQWREVKPGSLPRKIWEAVETMKKSGVVWGVPSGLYLPAGGKPGKGPSRDDQPLWVEYRDDRVYPIFLEEGRYVWAELDRSECLMRQSATRGSAPPEAMDRVKAFALAKHMEEERWRMTFFGEKLEKNLAFADEKAFLAMEHFLRDGLERRRERRFHGSTATDALASESWGETTVEMALCQAGAGMGEEELLEVRWIGGAEEGRWVGSVEAWRYLADHMSLARTRWQRQQGELRQFLKNRERWEPQGSLPPQP